MGCSSDDSLQQRQPLAFIIKTMFTEADILKALRDCYDPVLPCNIVDLGLVQQIAVTSDLDAPGASIPGVPRKYRVVLSLTPASNDDTATAQLSAQIVNRLAGLEQISHSEVLLLEAPIWTPLSITPAGRRILGLDGNPHLIQITS